MNIGFQLADGDDGYDPEKWQPSVGAEDLIDGIENFLRQTGSDSSPDAFARIRDAAHSRVVLSRLDVEDLGE